MFFLLVNTMKLQILIYKELYCEAYSLAMNKIHINSFLEKNGKEKAAIYRVLVMRGVDSKSAEKTALSRAMGSGSSAANPVEKAAVGKTATKPTDQTEILPKNEPKKRRGKKEEVSTDVDMVKAPAVPKLKAKGKVQKEKFEKNSNDTTVEMVI